jgi:hypothetical protein
LIKTVNLNLIIINIMEGEKLWRPLNDVSIPVFGASCSSLQESVYLIGGHVAGNKTPQTVLQVRNFDMNVMNWSPVAVNANNALNRAYHASATLGDSVYVFGGAVASQVGGHEIILDEVVKCTPDNLEGIKCVPSHCPNAQLKGLSASTMGCGDLLQKIVLFGGSSAEGTCDSSDLLVYVGNDPEEIIEGEQLKRVPCPGPAPSPRSNHAVAVAGHRQEYLIVSAGWDGAQAYNDLWVCDMTNLLSGRALEPEEVNTAPKGKKKDEVAIPDLYTWHQISLDEPLEARFMHGCWARCAGSLHDGLTIGVFGGMSAFGPIAHQSMLEYAVEFDGAECSAELKSASDSHSKEEDDMSSLRYGFGTETIFENGFPSLIFVFGGKNLDCDSVCCVLDGNSQIASHLATCLPLAVEDEETAESHIKLIKYPNGDVYEGEIFIDIDEEEGKETEEVDETAQIRHGNGVMKYADGAVYEGSWAYNHQHGHGKYITFDQETIYDGNFHENEFSGKGQLSLKNGNIVYNGTFDQGHFQGVGTMLDNVMKTMYDGEFSEGMKNGHGVLRKVNDDPVADSDSDELGPLIYDGTWKDDKPAGSGTLVLPGGHVYTGDIVNSIPEGKGVCKYADGGEYSGSWRSGKRNGTGRQIGRCLDEYTGKWVGDVRSGKGVWVSKRGDCYTGLWDANFPHGQGEMTYKVKEVQEHSSREKYYRGEWNHGKRHGFGEVECLDGSVKKGSWKTNQYDEALVDYDAGQ